MTYLHFAFQSFWHFAGVLILTCIVTFMAGNLAWRALYLFTVMLRGWPDNAPAPLKMDDDIEL